MDIRNATDLGKLVRRARKEAGLSQTELAELIGTTRQWLSRFEQGSNDVSLGAAFLALDALGLTISGTSPQDEVASAQNAAPNSSAPNSSEPNSLAQSPSQPPAAIVGTASALSSTESKSDRFSKLRERDALGGFRARNSSTPVDRQPIQRGPQSAHVPKGSNSMPGVHLGVDSTAAVDAEAANPEADSLSEETAASNRPSHVQPRATRPAAAYSIDADIARIASSSLFKKKS